MAIKKRKSEVGCAKIDSYFKVIPRSNDHNEKKQESKKNLENTCKADFKTRTEKNENETEQCSSKNDNKIANKKPIGLRDKGDNKGLRDKKPLANLVNVNNLGINVYCDIDERDSHQSNIPKRPFEVLRDDAEEEINTQSISEVSCSQWTISSPIEFEDSQDTQALLSIKHNDHSFLAKTRNNENSASQMAPPRPARKGEPKAALTDKSTGEPTTLFSTAHSPHLIPVKAFEVWKDPTISDQISDDDQELFFDFEEEDQEESDSYEDDSFGFSISTGTHSLESPSSKNT
ncbi:hypothetical protein BY458DRAFT_507681 [Sporodiniella umbellata]|nr:hypothetical protein BY458DRAFT_507681 [Sporodiniella umbellata]